jgi:hypothetical protein
LKDLEISQTKRDLLKKDADLDKLRAETEKINRDYRAMGENLSGREKSNNAQREKALSELQAKKQEVL